MGCVAEHMAETGFSQFVTIATNVYRLFGIPLPDIKQNPFSCGRITLKDDRYLILTSDEDCFSTGTWLGYKKNALRYDTHDGHQIETITALLKLNILHDMFKSACSSTGFCFSIAMNGDISYCVIKFFKDKSRTSVVDTIFISLDGAMFTVETQGFFTSATLVGNVNYSTALSKITDYISRTRGFFGTELEIWHELGKLADKLEAMSQV